MEDDDMTDDVEEAIEKTKQDIEDLFARVEKMTQDEEYILSQKVLSSASTVSQLTDYFEENDIKGETFENISEEDIKEMDEGKQSLFIAIGEFAEALEEFSDQLESADESGSNPFKMDDDRKFK